MPRRARSSIVRFRDFLNFNPRTIGDNVDVGHVLDRSRAKQFKNGVNYKIVFTG